MTLRTGTHPDLREGDPKFYDPWKSLTRDFWTIDAESTSFGEAEGKREDGANEEEFGPDEGQWRKGGRGVEPRPSEDGTPSQKGFPTFIRSPSTDPIVPFREGSFEPFEGLAPSVSSVPARRPAFWA